MGIPRYREKDESASRTGQTIGQFTTFKTSCPNVTYFGPTVLSYPLNQSQGVWTRCWDELHKGPPFREGGPFFLVRVTSEYQDKNAQEYLYKSYKYNGAFTINATASEALAIADGYAPTARSYGAQAFNKFRPVKPKVDGGQWAAELRDLPQNPWPWSVTNLRNQILKFKNLGSQFLNYEFGWKPFVKDLIKMYETSNRMENHLRFVENNQAKWLTRGGIIKNELTTTSSQMTFKSYPALVSWFYSQNPGPCTKSVITRDTIWFKARMKYFVPDLNVGSSRNIWNSRLVRHMYGLTLTPSLAWELIPFTWLQDWVINIGDVISNYSNSLYDNLVTKYAYVMRHRSTSIIYDEEVPLQISSPLCVGSNWGPTKPVPFKLRAVFTAECKERDGTSQYCFGGGGFLEEALTPRQERILWALGVSRATI